MNEQFGTDYFQFTLNIKKSKTKKNQIFNRIDFYPKKQKRNSNRTEQNRRIVDDCCKEKVI